MPTLAPTTPRPEAGGFERRTVSLDGVEVRTAADGSIAFRGHAAVFGARTWIGPKKFGFWERVERGAFTKTISESDIRFLMNHDPNRVLARNRAGTLRLVEDDEGLLVEADMAPTTYAKDLAISLTRGDVSQMSFAFEAVRDEWAVRDDGTDDRALIEVKGYDVSTVTFPAYDDTDASLRSVAFDVLCTRMGLSTTARSRLVTGLAHDEIDPEVIPILRDASMKIASLTEIPAPPEGTQGDGANDHAPAESTRGVPLSVMRLRHDLNGKTRGFTAPA